MGLNCHWECSKLLQHDQCNIGQHRQQLKRTTISMQSASSSPDVFVNTRLLNSFLILYITPIQCLWYHWVVTTQTSFQINRTSFKHIAKIMLRWSRTAGSAWTWAILTEAPWGEEEEEMQSLLPKLSTVSQKITCSYIGQNTCKPENGFHVWNCDISSTAILCSF